MGAPVLKKDQTYLCLRQAILSGRYAPGEKLPKELAFSKELGVAKITLRAALERLEREGMVARMPGKGTFVQKHFASNRVLIVFSRTEDISSTCHYIMPGIEAEAATRGLTTEVCFIDYLRLLEPAEALERLREKKLLGIVLIASSCNTDDPEIVALRDLGLPVVIAHGLYQDRMTGFALLYADVRQALRECVEYLAGLGHRRIKFLSMHADRMRGWPADELAELLTRHGADAAGKLIYHAPSHHKQAIAQALDRLLDDGPPPSAIQCFSDFYAMEALEYLRGRGLRVPEDIAVMGYCGYPGSTFLQPPLSTVDFDYFSIGRTAVRTLSEYHCWFGVDDVATPMVVTGHRLVERQSTKLRRREARLVAPVESGMEAALARG